MITVHEIGRDDIPGAEGASALHFITMELVDGPTLRELFRSGDLDLKKSLKLLAQVADGLAAAHAAGIVHGDVKPENIMLGSSGFAKILDFGLAKLRGLDRPVGNPQAATAPTETRGTDPGVVVGTIGYMSPEQAQGRAVDHRSDVFSLGCILYEVVTGGPAVSRRVLGGHAPQNHLRRSRSGASPTGVTRFRTTEPRSYLA